MTRNHSKLFVGVGVLCFVGVMALWLAASGDRAIADADKAVQITQTLTQAVNAPMVFNGKAMSQVTFAQNDGLVQRLSVYLNLSTQQAAKVKVYLTSPSGTKVLLVDGARSKAAGKSGIEGWFGTNGLQTTESLAAFAGEPVTGTWNLTIDSAAAGKLVKWSLNTDLGPNTLMAGMETYGEYGDDGGCDCQVGSTTEVAGGLLSALMLLGLVAIRRRD